MSTTRPLILITNDDGIQSPGIKHLWDALGNFAELAIVAPYSEKSGSGLSITWNRPLDIREFPWEDSTRAWSVNDGTPADCVKMALSVLMPKLPELIVSGVNSGSNAGRTILYSGTVGGVIEGALRGIPGIAFSFSDFDFPPLGVAQSYIASIVKHFLQHPIPSGSLINVNFPKQFEQGFQGIRMARQGRGYWMENPARRIHPGGNAYYWPGGRWSQFDEKPDSDISLLQQGYLTIAPIRIDDLTDSQLLQEHQEAIQQIEGNGSSPKKVEKKDLFSLE
jgi:5'-nucleotidase